MYASRAAGADAVLQVSLRLGPEAAAVMANRRHVLGDEWVGRSIAKRTSFNGDFQDLITRMAWHQIWGRAGLDERTRRLLAIAVTAALGRWEEFRLHVRAGLERGGFTQGS